MSKKEELKSENKLDQVFPVAQEMRENGNYSIGVLLTIIDGLFGDTLQCKAVKNQIRREMYLLIDRNQSVVYENLGLQKGGLAPKKMYVGEE